MDFKNLRAMWEKKATEEPKLQPPKPIKLPQKKVVAPPQVVTQANKVETTQPSQKPSEPIKDIKPQVIKTQPVVFQQPLKKPQEPKKQIELEVSLPVKQQSPPKHQEPKHQIKLQVPKSQPLLFQHSPQKQSSKSAEVIVTEKQSLMTQKPVEVVQKPKQEPVKTQQSTGFSVKNMKNMFQTLGRPIVTQVIQSSINFGSKRPWQEKKPQVESSQKTDEKSSQDHHSKSSESSHNNLAKSQQYEVDRGEHMLSIKERRQMAQRMLMNSIMGMQKKTEEKKEQQHTEQHQNQQTEQENTQNTDVSYGENAEHSHQEDSSHGTSQQQNSNKLFAEALNQPEQNCQTTLVTGEANIMTLDTRKTRMKKKRVEEDFDDM